MVWIDALCCCQENKVPELCIGFCIRDDAGGNDPDAINNQYGDEEEFDDPSSNEKSIPTKNEPPFWLTVIVSLQNSLNMISPWPILIRNIEANNNGIS